MPVPLRVKRWVAAGLGTLGGVVIAYYVQGKIPIHVEAAYSTNLPPTKWDNNWDRRDPRSLTKPLQTHSEDDNKYSEQSTTTTKATRHIILIRHGQYNTAGKTDSERILTDLGRLQAQATAKRLKELSLPYTLIVRSTMSRAQETSKIIEEALQNVAVEDDSLLIEGAPIQPDPPIHWKVERHFFQDGPRIEAAFRKYFHRADPSQEKDTYTILVCHANVIRYFVCRALQFPPEAWMRFSLNHASITWLSIRPSGRVSLLTLGDTGHMEPKAITTN